MDLQGWISCMPKIMEKKKILFVHIPKTAGTSIVSLFEGNCNFNRFKHRDVRSKVKDFDFSFCVVRNPYDRLISLYNYQEYYNNFTFEDFVCLLYKKYKKRDSIIQFIYKRRFVYGSEIIKGIFRTLIRKKISLPLAKINKNYSIVGLSAANNQSDWITENGKIVVDCVCRFENLSKDIKKVLKIAGIKGKLPHLNKTKHKNYREYYTKKTKKMVQEIYKKDFELFGYKF